jgi:23S rRNA (uracil1939-C5)-methyltransferase
LTNNAAAEAAAVNLADHNLHIDDLLANGQGVGRAGTLVTFVTGALPGEDVRIAVDAVKANYVSAHTREILTASPDRIASVCAAFPQCGGCQTLHLRYEAQLEWKRRMVADALARIGGLEGVVVAATQCGEFFDATRYRNKASLVPRITGTRGEIGFYAARSHRVVPIETCPVLLPWLDDAVRALARFADKHPQFLRDVRHIVVRSGIARKTLVLALCTKQPQGALASFTDQLRKHIPALSGIVASWDPASANAIFGRRFATIWGSAETIERVAEATFHFGIASFFQINTRVLERIVEHLCSSLEGAGRVVDLYCGVGTFAIVLAKRGMSVTGVESYPRAVEEAAANAAINDATSVAFECATVVEAVNGARGQTLLRGADAVILDPPRRGCETEVLTALAGARVPRIEYLSCNPATLARDARKLVDAGYRLSSVVPFDMFPFTGHVEALAEFTR